jgi:ABC-type multidrug transport system fused ATPase/permease subunit
VKKGLIRRSLPTVFSHAILSAQVLLGGNLRKLYRLTFANIVIGFLDLLGVLLLGLIGGMAVLGIQSKTYDSGITKYLEIVHLQDISFQSLVSLLALLACLMLVAKSVISAMISRRILIYLSIKSAELSRNLTSKLFSSSPAILRKRSEKEIIYSLTAGVEDLSLRVVAPIAMLASDLTLLVLLAFALLFTQPLVAIGTIIYFLLVMILLQKLTQSQVATLSRDVTTQAIGTSELISQTISGIRELFVKSQQHQVVDEISIRRFGMAQKQAKLTFIPTIGKYVMETSLVIGSLALAGAQFVLVDASQAFSSIAIFLTAGTRIAPALLRIQQSLSTYRAGVASSERTLRLVEELQDVKYLENSIVKFSNQHPGFSAQITMQNARVAFPDSSWIMSPATLSFSPGERVAVVGPSGGGKTTLIDLILGIYNPIEGKVLISDFLPLEAISKWPGAVAYVPQDTFILNGTLRENICFGYKLSEVPIENVQKAVEQANLTSLVESLPEGLETIIGETGTKLSGGQKQRVSIARALLTDPLFLVLDEATSALDMESEDAISETLKRLPGQVLVVMIAHRLTSVREATKVLYVENGAIRESGTLDEVRSKVPEFDKYAEISGLK